MSVLAGSTSTVPPTAKAVHYSSALSAALLHGAWADGHAGKDAKGYELSWGELVRKWGKHTGGNTALVHHLRDISLLYLSAHSTAQTSASGYITVSSPSASQSQPLPNVSGTSHTADGPHSSTSSSAETGENSGSGSSFIHIPHPHLRRTKSKSSIQAPRTVTNGSPSVGGSTVRHGEKAAYLAKADLDGDDAEGEEHWAEGCAWWNGVGMDQVDEVREGIRQLEDGLKGDKYKAGEVPMARLLVAYHYHAIGEHESALAAFENVDWHVETKAGDGVRQAAILDRIRGRCLQGMSHELLDPASPAALQCYLSIIPLLTSVFPSPVPAYLSPSTTAPLNRLVFEPNRELHRWLSTSLCRAAILSSRQQGSISQSLQILRTYHAFAASWPSSFRPHQRHRMLMLYLTALASGLPGDHVSAEVPYLLTGGETSLTARAVWRKEATLAIRDGQRLLFQTTSFPRTGAVNKPVTDFVNLCVTLANRSPGLTTIAIEVLWWSMTLTFQSQSVLSHLTRLLERKGEHTDAKRTFQLYVQLVLKSRETAHPEASLHLEAAPSDEVPTTEGQREASTTPGSGEAAQGVDSEKVEADSEGEREFIEALLVGARVLSRELGDLDEGWRYACLAREAVSKAKPGSLGSKIRAEVEEILGIVRMAMASTGTFYGKHRLTPGADPTTRPQYQAQAINHLLTAAKLNPSSAGILYHLAYAQAEARAIGDATQSIHTALEIDSNNVQAWHLLALLLTAKRDWEGARKACEAGVAVWEAEELADAVADDEEEEEESPVAPELPTGVESRDFAVSHSRSGTTQSSPSSSSPPLLHPSGKLLPLGHAPPARIPRSRRLDQVIRLRMTLNVITEKTQGAGMAMLRQQELFAFFSARSGENRQQYRDGSGSMRTLPSISTVGGLGGSYVSLLAESPVDGAVNVHPPTPEPPQGSLVDSPPRITQSTASSPGASSPEAAETDDDSRVETLSRDFADMGSVKEKSNSKDSGRSSTLGSRRLAKHLHVPGVKGMGKGKPSSVRRVQGSGDSDLTSRNRTASNSSAALSVVSTAAPSVASKGMLSYLRGTGPTPSASNTPPIAAPSYGRTPGECRTLSNLWLMSAATFRRWGKMEQCLVAITEAEALDPENADVWIQHGLYHSAATPPNAAAAESAYTKAILLHPLHAAAHVHLSNLYLKTGQVDLAHTILSQVTQDNGWDLPEAWVLLARACKEQGRDARERECLMQALMLEETRPARGWREAVDRWL